MEKKKKLKKTAYTINYLVNFMMNQSQRGRFIEKIKLKIMSMIYSLYTSIEDILLKKYLVEFEFYTVASKSLKDYNKKHKTSYLDYPFILKLHGSTNWLTSYLRPDGNKLKSIQETPTDDFYVYEFTINPYNTYNGRFMSGYADYSYGYYPPNLPLLGEKIPEGYLLTQTTITLEGMPKATSSSEGLVSMPLIIPPVKHKNYSHYGDIFSQLWSKTEESLIKADRIIIIGYSFPATDIQTDILFKKAFVKRSSMPEIIIVDPAPEDIFNRFTLDYGIKESNITIYKTHFNQSFDVDSLFL